MGYVYSIEGLTAFTDLDRNICLSVLKMIESEFGEIGLGPIEDNCISFDVYRAYYENAPEIIENGEITLKLANKFDDPCFNLSYEITLNTKSKQL